MVDGMLEEYHLDVIGPDGITLLGIGPDEHPGQASPHFAAIESLLASGAAATLLHEPRPSESYEAHVMAAVPLGSSPFYVVIEQPVDVALALPLQLRNRLFLSIGLGLTGTLLVAWVTTRHVVKPTERLTLAAERMAGGDLASPIEVVAQDEVGQLAESLETMRQRLRAAHETVEQTNRELESRVADRTARLGQVVRKTILAQEEERLRLARELHDETAQTLAALTIALDRARDDLDGATADAREQIREARAIAGRLLSETRRLILGLRPSVLDDLGLVPAIRWLCETGLADRGVEVAIEADQGGARLPGYVEVALFRIIQEAVGNIARHADATHVRIGMSVAAEVARVTVADDGRGFDVARAMGPDGSDSSVGLVGMQERVAILGGSIEIRSAAGSGTEIVVEVPVVPESA
jgi:signal transduction histidine kinase